MMEKIGNRTVVYSGTFIVPEGEDVWFTADASGWSIKINIQFERNGAEQGIRIEPKTDHAKIIFVKWDNSIGTTTTTPAPLGSHQDGRKLSFMATNYCIGGVNRLDIQLLLGGTNGAA